MRKDNSTGGDFRDEDFILISSLLGRVLFYRWQERRNGKVRGQVHQNTEQMSHLDWWRVALSSTEPAANP